MSVRKVHESSSSGLIATPAGRYLSVLIRNKHHNYVLTKQKGISLSNVISDFFSSQSILGTTITIENFIIGQTDHASLRSLKTIRMIFNFNPAGTVSAECQDANKGQLKMTNHFYFRYEVIKTRKRPLSALKDWCDELMTRACI